MSALIAAGAAAKAWVTVLGLLAVQGTLLALVAFALTRLGKLRPAWQAALWLVVAAKLALPWGPATPWSLSSLIASLTASHHAGGAVSFTAGAAHVVAQPDAWPAVGWLALAIVWLAGASYVVVRTALAHVRLARAARRAPDAPAAAQALLASLRPARRGAPVLAECGAPVFADRDAPVFPDRGAPVFADRDAPVLTGRRGPRLVIGAADIGPHVVGLLRSVIVVPHALIDEPALLRAALLHELAHVRRRDALGRLVQIAASTLMWWLPVMRLVNRRLDHAREAACDAWALETGDVSRPAYARLLVRMAQLGAGRGAASATPTAALALALPVRHALDARIAAVLGPVAHARLTHVHRVALAAFAVIALGGARTAAAARRADTCVYSSHMAEALFAAFPQADVDGDGTLSRDEACDLQAELRKVPEEDLTSRLAPQAEAEVQTLLAGPLCRDRTSADLGASPEAGTCRSAEGDTP